MYNLVKIIEGRKHINTPSFTSVMENNAFSYIGEIRRASPEYGLSNDGFNADELISGFNKCADAISVCTEEAFFKGNDGIIERTLSKTHLPIIKRDFIISPIQIFSAKALGVSAITFVCAALKLSRLKEYKRIADAVKIEPIAEIFSDCDLNNAFESGFKWVLINAFDYKNQRYDESIIWSLIERMPDNINVLLDCKEYTQDTLDKIHSLDIKGIFISRDFFNNGDCTDTLKRIKGYYGSVTV
ncbi:MAG: hypothetical protein LBU94_05420 [Clostridiales bacterium]|nr:hypothetical protein [Clostridiales bacterium]